ncbi:MAG: hypothetical protein MHM6MM_003881 [Cercozoa sp. M6MM]
MSCGVILQVAGEILIDDLDEKSDADFAFVALNSALLLGALICALAPLALEIGGRTLRLTDALGSGVLIGTALGVLVPEGVRAGGESAGVFLLLGYLGMRVLEEVSHGALSVRAEGPGHTGHSQSHTGHIQGHTGQAEAEDDSEEMLFATPQAALLSDQQDGRREVWRLSAALFAHCALDGVALGTASVGAESLASVVFLAVMMHKAPTAFAYSVRVLRVLGNKRQAAPYLVAFALVSPIAAAVTRLCASSWQSDAAVSRALLVGAGSFVRVALHEHHTNDALPEEHERLETLLRIGGAFVPCLIALFLHHEH